MSFAISSIDCKARQLQIIGGATLQNSNTSLQAIGLEFSYAGTIAMMLNVWRQHAVNFYQTWSTLFGATSAEAHARQVPPKAMSSRWGLTIAVPRAC